jgi:hypothetical protein
MHQQEDARPPFESTSCSSGSFTPIREWKSRCVLLPCRVGAVKLELAVPGFEVRLDTLRLVDRATIPNQGDRRRGANHQALEKFPQYFGIDRAVVTHETEFATRTECRDYAQQEAASRHFHDRRFTNERPRRSGVAVGADSRFVRKADGWALRSGLGTNCGLERSLPGPHQCHVQLLRLVERFLRREAQRLHDPPNEAGDDFMPNSRSISDITHKPKANLNCSPVLSLAALASQGTSSTLTFGGRPGIGLGSRAF